MYIKINVLLFNKDDADPRFSTTLKPLHMKVISFQSQMKAQIILFIYFHGNIILTFNRLLRVISQLPKYNIQQSQPSINLVTAAPSFELIIYKAMISAGLVLMLLLLAGFAQQPRLIFVQQVFRHGHREPIHPSEVDGSTFVKDMRSSGELTKLGKSMHYILGQNLYNFYWNQLFGGTPFANTYSQSKFYVKSTNDNRTIQNVNSQLLGIFENVDKLTIDERDVPFSLPVWPNASRQAGDVYVKSPLYHPIPVHVEKAKMSPWDSGDFLKAYSPKQCFNQRKWINQNFRNPNVIAITKDPSFQKAIAAVAKVLKTNVTFREVARHCSIAICLHYEGRAVDPIWINPSPTKAALDAIRALDMYISFYYQEKQIKISASGYFEETNRHFKRVTKDQSGVQWAFYSAHDGTIGNYLAALGMTSVQCIYQSYLKGITKDNQTDNCIVEYPGFASTLIFEVYKYQNDTFTFKIRYNGLLRKIPFCNNKFECPVERYYQWFQSWKVKDVVKACGIIDKQKKKARTYLHGLEANFEQTRYLESKLHYYKHETKKLRKHLEDYEKLEAEFHKLKKKLALNELILSQYQKDSKKSRSTIYKQYKSQ